MQPLFVRHVCFMTLMGEMGALCQISEDGTILAR